MEQEHRKYKWIVVFLGNAVVDQHHDEATFGGLGSAPATLEAAKAADFYGCLPGHVVEVADGEQAYVQAEMKGTPTWVCLPPDQIPAWWTQGTVRPPVRWYLLGRTLSWAHDFSGRQAN